jgi:hypothetical protein
MSAFLGLPGDAKLESLDVEPHGMTFAWKLEGSRTQAGIPIRFFGMGSIL